MYESVHRCSKLLFFFIKHLTFGKKFLVQLSKEVKEKMSMKNHWNTTRKLLVKAYHCVFILKQRRSMFTNIVCIWMKCRWRKTALCGALLPLCRDLRVVRHTTKHKPCQCHNKFWTWWMVTIVPGKCILRRNSKLCQWEVSWTVRIFDLNRFADFSILKSSQLAIWLLPYDVKFLNLNQILWLWNTGKLQIRHLIS